MPGAAAKPLRDTRSPAPHLQGALTEASGGTRTRVSDLEGRGPNHWTTLAMIGREGLEPSTHELEARCSSAELPAQKRIRPGQGTIPGRAVVLLAWAHADEEQLSRAAESCYLVHWRARSACVVPLTGPVGVEPTPLWLTASRSAFELRTPTAVPVAPG